MTANGSIKIEHNIPIQNVRRKWPFRNMKVGDSFVVPPEDGPKVRCAADSFKRSPAANGAFNFTCRTTAEGLRVWRVA